MKNLILGFSMAALIVNAPALARNDFKEFSVADAFALDVYKAKLGNEVKFYFGNAKHGPIIKRYGEWPTQKKTNAFNKSDEFACQWALLSALKSLKKRALAEGGNAVINIKSNNDHNVKSNRKKFECEVGNIIASVALLGTVVKLKK